MIAFTPADAAENWGLLRGPQPDQCRADSDGEHLHVLALPGDPVSAPVWRCHWCGVAAPAGLWCVAVARAGVEAAP